MLFLHRGFTRAECIIRQLSFSLPIRFALINSKSALDKNKLIACPLLNILPLRKKYQSNYGETGNIISTYQQIIQESEQALQRARKRIYYISLLRLVLFVEAIAAAFIFWSDGWLSLFVFAILPFISFIWLVKRHNLWFYRKDYLKKKIEINEQELRAIQYDFPISTAEMNISTLRISILMTWMYSAIIRFSNISTVLQRLSASSIWLIGSTHIWN